MIPIQKITGRLGNQMFQFAFLYNYAKNKGIDYYFQDPDYFKESCSEIKTIFGMDIPERIDKVAIHVRRGDYVNNPFYVDLTKNGYYTRAMDEFESEQFLIFSDDVEWCKEQPLFAKCDFFEGTGDDVFDLNIMAACSGHIIANSSYSWWAAFLSPYTKKVIAPAHWHLDKIERTKCPPEWIRR